MKKNRIDPTKKIGHWEIQTGNFYSDRGAEVTKPYRDGVTLKEIVDDGWARAFLPEQTLAEARAMGFELTVTELQRAWKVWDRFADSEARSLPLTIKVPPPYLGMGSNLYAVQLYAEAWERHVDYLVFADSFEGAIATASGKHPGVVFDRDDQKGYEVGELV